jgi:hypothetical protein
MERQHGPMKLRHAMFVLFMTTGPFLFAQASHEPTSATDADVKLHYTKRIRKSAVPARVDERYGESVDKRGRTKRMTAREARVFKRHNHFALKEKNKARSRSTKKTVPAKN